MDEPHSDERLRSLSLRHLKAVLRVAELHNVTQAAQSLSRSQTAVTKSINEIESSLGYRLFDRSSAGITPTAHGQAFAKRLSSIKRILENANETYQGRHSRPRAIQHIPLFTMDISARRLAILIAVASTGEMKSAANEMKLTPSAVYKFVSELEAQLDDQIFERRPTGLLRATEFGEILLGHINLIFSELRHALEDLSSLDGRLTGRVTIGTLPSTRAILVPMALQNFLNEYPHIRLSTQEAPYEEMALSLANGDLDMIVTGTRPLAPRPGLTTTHLCNDKLTLVARSDHALLRKTKINTQDLNDAKWILPPRTTPARQVYDSIIAEIGVSSDIAYVESNSIIIMRNLLLRGEFISISSAHQTQVERDVGTISIVPFALPDDSWPVGVIVRDNTEPSPAAAAFLKRLKATAEAL